jgi:hypothetical protein
MTSTASTVAHVNNALSYAYGSAFYSTYILCDMASRCETLHIRMSRGLPSVQLDEAVKTAQRILDENSCRMLAVFDWGEYL